MKFLTSRFQIHPLNETCDRVSEWFDSPLGRRLLEQEQRAIEKQMRYMFGYHFMQLSAVKGVDFSSLSRINHCFSLGPSAAQTSAAEVNGIADFDQLPFDDEVIDVTVVHHVLEFSENPHQVLKEASRVTMPRGYVIILAFNPMSVAGLLQPLFSLFNLGKISRRRALTSGRMRDWLAFLDFTCTANRQVFYNLPINDTRYLASTGFMERLLNRYQLPGGMTNLIVARKDKAGLTPIKPKWQGTRLLGAMPIPKQAIRADGDKEGLILPFRTKIKKEF